MNLWSVEHNVEHFLTIFGGCNSKATSNPPKSDDKNGQEMFNIVFNWSEVQSEKKYYF